MSEQLPSLDAGRTPAWQRLIEPLARLAALLLALLYPLPINTPHLLL